MNLKTLSIVLGAAISCGLLCSCSSVDSSDNFNGQQVSLPCNAKETPIAHINANVWGIYFFKWPVMTGSAARPGELVFFQDSAAQLDPIMGMITRESTRVGGNTITDLHSHKENVWIAPLFVFFYKQIEMSGNSILIQHSAAAPNPAPSAQTPKSPTVPVSPVVPSSPTAPKVSMPPSPPPPPSAPAAATKTAPKKK